MLVGILALQGDFETHRQALNKLGVRSVLVRNKQQLNGIDAIILPGGESTTQLKLLDIELKEALCESILGGLATLATCAGLILLAKRVKNPAQDSLGLIDIEVERNSYGRQIDSFVDPQLEITKLGTEKLSKLNPELVSEGVFIRAPRIKEVGPEVNVLMLSGEDPVLVTQNNIIGATFHPEITEGKSIIHQLLISHVA